MLQRTIYPKIAILSLLLTSVACSPYHYGRQIKSYRKSNSTRSVSASAKKFQQKQLDGPDFVHAMGVVYDYHMWSAFGTQTMVGLGGLSYLPRNNFFQFSNQATLSLDPSVFAIFPVQNVRGSTLELSPFPPSLFVLTSLSYNIGRRSVRAAENRVGIGVGAGYMLGLLMATDYNHNGLFSHGPGGHLSFRFNIVQDMEIKIHGVYSVRHAIPHMGLSLNMYLGKM
jgi:hypothetical protein